MTTLRSIIESLDTLDPDETIYAAKPWTPESRAVVTREPDNNSLPHEAQGLRYFLEVSIANELKKAYPNKSTEWLGARIIQYATKDA